jgi:hypothetical protein
VIAMALMLKPHNFLNTETRLSLWVDRVLLFPSLPCWFLAVVIGTLCIWKLGMQADVRQDVPACPLIRFVL